MEASTETQAKGRRAKPAGRLGADKQEAVIKTKIVRERIDELVRLKHAADEAGTNFNEAIKTAAEQSGLLATTVRKFVIAKAGESFEEEKRKVEQLSLVFEECE